MVIPSSLVCYFFSYWSEFVTWLLIIPSSLVCYFFFLLICICWTSISSFFSLPFGLYLTYSLVIWIIPSFLVCLLANFPSWAFDLFLPSWSAIWPISSLVCNLAYLLLLGLPFGRSPSWSAVWPISSFLVCNLTYLLHGLQNKEEIGRIAI